MILLIFKILNMENDILEVLRNEVMFYFDRDNLPGESREKLKNYLSCFSLIPFSQFLIDDNSCFSTKYHVKDSVSVYTCSTFVLVLKNTGILSIIRKGKIENPKEKFIKISSFNSNHFIGITKCGGLFCSNSYFVYGNFKDVYLKYNVGIGLYQGTGFVVFNIVSKRIIFSTKEGNWKRGVASSSFAVLINWEGNIVFFDFFKKSSIFPGNFKFIDCSDHYFIGISDEGNLLVHEIIKGFSSPPSLKYKKACCENSKFLLLTKKGQILLNNNPLPFGNVTDISSFKNKFYILVNNSKIIPI